jgi:hypothetical protein
MWIGLLKPSSSLTCVDLEKELGLQRGDVSRIISDPDGSVQVELLKTPTTEQKAKLEQVFAMKIAEVK